MPECNHHFFIGCKQVIINALNSDDNYTFKCKKCNLLKHKNIRIKNSIYILPGLLNLLYIKVFMFFSVKTVAYFIVFFISEIFIFLIFMIMTRIFYIKSFRYRNM